MVKFLKIFTVYLSIHEKIPKKFFEIFFSHNVGSDVTSCADSKYRIIGILSHLLPSFLKRKFL